MLPVVCHATFVQEAAPGRAGTGGRVSASLVANRILLGVGCPAEQISPLQLGAGLDQWSGPIRAKDRDALRRPAIRERVPVGDPATIRRHRRLTAQRGRDLGIEAVLVGPVGIHHPELERVGEPSLVEDPAAIGGVGSPIDVLAVVGRARRFLRAGECRSHPLLITNKPGCPSTTERKRIPRQWRPIKRCDVFRPIDAAIRRQPHDIESLVPVVEVDILKCRLSGAQFT